MKKVNEIIHKIIKLPKKVLIILIIIILAVGYFGWTNFISAKSNPQYQTAQVTKGTLVVSLTESGQVSVANRVSIVTQASGIVKDVYVKSGDYVNAGDKIADIALDTAGQQRQAQAYSSLLSAQNSVNSANAQMYTLQNNLFVANQKFMTDRGVANPSDQQKADPVYIEENATWLAAEAAYKNQTGVVSQAQAGLNNASLAYQLASGTITSPTSGSISDLVITNGMQIGSSNTTAGSSTNTSNQAVASIQTGNSTAISVSISEVDAPKIKVGQNATITFDAIPNKTFTGKVAGINTTGGITSGVVSYPAIIVLDSVDKSIFPNMSATANIITKVVDNALLVPSAAVQTTNGQSTVRILQNGKLSNVNVVIGDSSSAETVITSGLSEGQTIVTSIINSTSTSQSSGTSVFSSFNRGFGGNTGGAVRIRPGN
jgi:membrane fusion protein, macrolide-specific efflux system